MDNELKQIFTRRLSQCNRGEMIVIIYDIYFAYEKDICDAFSSSNYEAFKASIHKAQDTLQELMKSLDFSYPIAKELYPLYQYCYKQLARAIYEYRLDGVNDAGRIMKRLYSSFAEAARQDTSEPLMSNVQQVYAGMTYGRQDLNESCIDDNKRGFFV